MFFFLAVTLALSVGGARARQAISCSASMGSLPFGTINVLSGARVDAVSTLTINCTGGPKGSGHVVRACASIGPGHAIGHPARRLFNAAAAKSTLRSREARP